MLSEKQFTFFIHFVKLEIIQINVRFVYQIFQNFRYYQNIILKTGLKNWKIKNMTSKLYEIQIWYAYCYILTIRSMFRFYCVLEWLIWFNCVLGCCLFDVNLTSLFIHIYKKKMNTQELKHCKISGTMAT